MRRSGKSGSCVIIRAVLTEYRYEAEIGRLRRELDGRGGGSAGGSATSPPELPGPGGAELERPGYPPTLPGPSLNGEAGRCYSKLFCGISP